jgi:phosphatidylglycerol:prolipoprotein diacylglycerol transferase
MSDSNQYWVHNLDPYIFTVSEIPFDALKTWYGITIAAVFVVGGLIGTTLWQKKAQAAGQSGTLQATLKGIIGFVTIGAALLFGLKSAGIEWGLRWYSTMYLLAFIQGYIVLRHWIRKGTIMLTPYLLDSLIAYVIIGMIAGARFFYVVIYNLDAYAAHPLDAFKVWEGGLSFHGGIVGVITAMVIFCRRHRIPFFHLADKIVLTVPFGIGVGRIGNFMNGELYGRIIQSENVPWAVIFEHGGPQPRHPSQLYQSLGEGWLLLITLYLLSRRKLPQGVLAAAFVFFYGFYRYFVEFFREADEQLAYYFNNTTTMGQILCVLTSLAGVTVFIIVRKNIVTGSEAWKKDVDAFVEKRLQLETGMVQKGNS